ncbi:MAG: UDP-2,4-diacetamido-2,4,6-trideoxy-beta-L-altropyranose hydrolase [Clostridia bacterium]|nr:UDP-2,4-diacetamido-2,4,6-trideoxy-beta-L-altropyranose hydrolase [Clostridia bacterium]
MKIIIRADGGTEIGLGHIMRTSVLAEKLRVFAEVMYICKHGCRFIDGIRYVKRQGFDVIELDEISLIGQLDKIQADCLITDSYDVNEVYFDTTKKVFPVTGYIDDLNRFKPNVDFIVNQNVYARDLNYENMAIEELFLGTRYALLREEFKNLPSKQIKADVKDVLVTLGGADIQNVSGDIAKGLYDQYPFINIHVAVGPSFIHGDKLKELENDRIKVYYMPKMSDLMSKCDLAVSACGSTLYELFACGTPVIGVVVAENQKIAAQKVNDVGAAFIAKDIGDIVALAGKCDFDKRFKMSQTSRALVDGWGSDRLAKEIRRLVMQRLGG